jgi:hypothetical protein
MTTPAPAIDKYESRRIRVAIRRVLLDVWDPIGVRDEPYAQDEYDSYLGDVFHLLTTGAADTELKKYLNWVSAERMGLRDAPEEVMSDTIRALRNIQISPDPAKGQPCQGGK